jgi:hypothetical protein
MLGKANIQKLAFHADTETGTKIARSSFAYLTSNFVFLSRIEHFIIVNKARVSLVRCSYVRIHLLVRAFIRPSFFDDVGTLPGSQHNFNDSNHLSNVVGHPVISSCSLGSPPFLTDSIYHHL